MAVASSLPPCRVAGMASVYLRDGSKYWRACIRTGDGKRRNFSTGKEDKSEAMALAASLEVAVKRNKESGRLRTVLDRIVEDSLGAPVENAEEWLEAWSDRLESEVAEKTDVKYSGVKDELVAWLRENNIRSLAAITVAHVHKIRDQWGKVHAASTANVKLKVLRVILNDAWRAGVVPENVAAKVKIISKKKRRDKGEDLSATRRPFTDEELALVEMHSDDIMRAVTELGLWTGQRYGDVATLTPSRFSLTREGIRIIQGDITLQTSKTGVTIALPLMDSVLRALEKIEWPKDPNAFLFPELATASTGKRSKRFRAILEKAGLVEKHAKYKGSRKSGEQPKRRKVGELGYHSLRHTATSRLKSAGVSDAIARAIIGHESEAVSRIYTHFDRETLKSALEKASK